MAIAGRKCSAVLFLLLSLTPLLFSQATSPCLSCGQTDLYSRFDYPSSTFDMALVATITDFNKDRQRADLERQYLNFLLEKYEVDIRPSVNSTVSVLPAPDASIRVLYEKSEMVGGNLTSRLVNATCLNSPGSPPKTNSNGEAICRIDPSIYEGKCVQFYFEFYGSRPPGMPQLNPTYASANICDSNRAAFSAMGAALSAIGTESLGNPLCIIGFIIFGLFISSMFFSGRSPAMLLDITTPLLPKPKSLSYSGMAFGATYVRMRRELESMRKAGGKLLKNQSAQLRSELTRRGANPREIDEIMSLAKEAPHMGYLALRALRDGKTVAQAKEIARLRPVGGNEADLKKAASTLKEMRQRGKEDAALMAVSSMMEADLTDKAIHAVTGNVPPRVAKVTKAIFEDKRSPLRYLMPEDVRDQIRVGVGSASGGLRNISKLTKAAAKTVVSMVSKSAGAELRPSASSMPFAPAPKKDEKSKDLYLTDIRSRISEMYKTQVQECKANAAMYMIKKIFEARGVNLALSQKELVGIGKLEIASHMGLSRNMKTADIEKKILAILSGKGSMETKAAELMNLASQEGVQFDRAGVSSFLSKIQSIEDAKGKAEKNDRQKLQELHDYLRDRYKVDQAGKIGEMRFSGSGDFYPWVGQETLRYKHRGKEYDDTWTFMLLRSFLENASSSKPASLSDSAKLMWLRFVNEMWGLLPSDPKLMPGMDSELRKTMGRAEEYAKSLLSEEGKRKLKEMKHVFELFYSPEVSKFPMAGAAELAREYGPNPAYWNADVKGFWRTFVPGSSILATSAPVAKTSVMEQAYGAKYYSHVQPKESYENIARDMFYNRIRSMIGSKYPDAYHTSNQEFRLLASTYGAYKERYAQLFGDTAGKRSDPSWVTDSMVENFTRRGITLDELRNFVWVRTREGGYIPFTEGREAHGLRLSDGDRVVGGNLAVNLGGRWARFDAQKISERISRENISLSPDLARMQSEVMRMINTSPSAQEGLYKHKVIDDETRSAMVKFAESLKAWAGPDKRDVAALYVHKMCKEAGDSAAIDRTGLLSIRPERDLEFVGFRKTFQKVWAPFSRGVEQLLTSAFLPQANEMLHVTTQSEYLRAKTAALSARLAAAVHSPETDPSISTGIYRKDVQEFVDAMSRYRSAWDSSITRDPRGNSFSIGSQLNFAAMHHHGPALHPPAISSLDEFTGRKFRKFMEGMRLAPMSINWMLGAPFILQVRGALTSWYGYPSKHDKSFHPLHPYEMSPSRTIDGLRSLFDPFHSAMDLTSGSFKKIASYALSPFSFILNPGGATTKALDYLSQKISSPSGRDNEIPSRAASAVSYISSALDPKTVFHSQDSFSVPHYARESGIRERLAGNMTLREYGGKAVQDGQVRSHEDQAWMYKNLNVVWNVNTNPGVSYIDFNYNVLADPRLASHLLAGTKYTSYFSQDEYLQKQANMGFVQRHVSAYELTESREDELRSYQNPRQNRMWGLLNPITFFINNPIWPLSYATYESLAHQVPQKFRNMAEESEKRKELRFADLHSPPKTFMSGMPVGSASEEMEYTTLQPSQVLTAETITEKFIRRAGQIYSSVLHNTQFVHCAVCRSPMQKDGACPVCSGKALYFNNLQKRQWAELPKPKKGKNEG